ncbi:MAG TPA: hypothetical protein VHE14_07680 [Solirubrobacteraceae bacterium]|nr:hypothetical protein [Solirubrobacteraceae bacterium]
MRFVTKLVLLSFFVGAFAGGLLPASVALAQTPSSGGYSAVGPRTESNVGPTNRRRVRSNRSHRRRSSPNRSSRAGGGGKTGGGGSKTGTLPFTGLDIALIAAVGAALVALGVALRRSVDRPARTAAASSAGAAS